MLTIEIYLRPVTEPAHTPSVVTPTPDFAPSVAPTSHGESPSQFTNGVFSAESVFASAQAPRPARFEGPLRSILLRRIKARTGASEADIQDALDQVDADRPILDWLLNGGLEQIIQAVLAVLKLFG